MGDERPDWWPTPSSPAASRVMEANLRRDTSPKLAVRRELHGRGMRRLHRRLLLARLPPALPATSLQPPVLVGRGRPQPPLGSAGYLCSFIENFPPYWLMRFAETSLDRPLRRSGGNLVTAKRM